MRALVLERTRELRLRDIDVDATMGPGDVRIAVRSVGICGSDLHYYLHGAIGPYVVREPMVLGHEASGVVTAVGSAVTTLKPGDRVCMEPGVPDWASRASREGIYNLDPAVRFWATPPVHGCLMPEVVHPANLCFPLPDNVSFAEGAFVEPLAVGLQAAVKARITPGQVGVVLGAGTIGVLTALSALAAGCAEVVITDVQPEKLAIAGRYPGLRPVNVAEASAPEAVRSITGGWGADCVFEASGSPRAFAGMTELAAPGGVVVLVGIPPAPVPFDVAAAQAKELRFENVFRYAHVFPKAVALLASGKIDVKPLISRTFSFEQSVEAFEFAAENRPDVIKTQISLEP
ncbi:NAD(P)-dependent alcohol dehydrogenase [Roseomonas elaeocarpi]|uniref:NAD(P)-dependent alcohol dehydrogenase n=1 Tax=Roseomonas elaeocarpi TaxID=907779 RepID=A0ABV6JQ30_9PROT